MYKKYITVKLAGGLGNQLFIWATASAISKRNNYELKFDASECTQYGCELERFGIELTTKPSIPSNGELRSRYRETPNFVVTLIRNLRTRMRFFRIGGIFWERPGGFDKSVFDIKNGKVLRGYFQSFKYFEDFQEIIRKNLDNLKFESEQFLSLSTSLSSSPWVAIHIRRQDYEDLQNTFGIVGVNYYKRAMDQVESLIPNVRKYVFSDDINQAKLLIPDCNGYIGSSELESAAETLVLMSRANAIIGANSSFSWWAAFLMKSDDNLKYFPDPWFIDKKLNNSDLVPPTWSRVSIFSE